MKKRLDEITRKNLVGKTKVQSPIRYNNRLKYHSSNQTIVKSDKLISEDMLITENTVGDYKCTVAFNNVLYNLYELVSKQRNHSITMDAVIKALDYTIDQSDILVDCKCDDFKYRYAYYATKYGYKYGDPERRPPNKTNPKDNQGSVCKHLAMLLDNKKWLVRIASILSIHIRSNYEKILDLLNTTQDQFYLDVKVYKQANRLMNISNTRPISRNMTSTWR